MYVLILVLIPESWRPPLIKLSIVVLLVSFFIRLFQLLLGDPGWRILDSLRHRVITGACILIGMMVVIVFGLGMIIIR